MILDAGSGLRPLGNALEAEFAGRPVKITLLLTHTHWDHIQGFPFFVPAYHVENHLRVIGYEGARRGLQDTLAGQMENPYFPVALAEMPGNILFEELKTREFSLGTISVRSCRTKHPGITMAFRLETSAGAICYVPDHECSPDDPGSEVMALIQGADVLILDAQYTAEEYQSKKGWGHGCLDSVVKMACKSGVKHLYLFHHDPGHNDAFIAQMLLHARELASRSGTQVHVAMEGLEISLAAKA
jgi:phosphoribosyl 1,2-cyclic phosphodiesterase